jgi:hypothetical protein
LVFLAPEEFLGYTETGHPMFGRDTELAKAEVVLAQKVCKIPAKKSWEIRLSLDMNPIGTYIANAPVSSSSSSANKPSSSNISPAVWIKVRKK